MCLSAEVEAGLDAASADDFFQSLEIPGPLVLAMAVEGLGLAVSTVVDDGTTEAVTLGHERLVAALEELAAEARILVAN